MKPTSFLLLIAAVTGCGTTLPAAGELELRILTPGVSSGKIAAAFINGSGTTVGIGHLECMTQVEAKVGGNWEPVDLQADDETCILPLYLIGPHRAYGYETRAPVEAGTYRLVVQASVEGDQPDLPGGGRHLFVVRSNTFEVKDLTGPR